MSSRLAARCQERDMRETFTPGILHAAASMDLEVGVSGKRHCQREVDS